MLPLLLYMCICSNRATLFIHSLPPLLPLARSPAAGSRYKRDPGVIRPLTNLGPASRYNDTTFTLAGVIYDNVASSRPIMSGLNDLFAALDTDRGAHFALCDMEELHADGIYMIEAYKYAWEHD